MVQRCGWCPQVFGDDASYLAHIIAQHAPKPGSSRGMDTTPHTSKGKKTTVSVLHSTPSSKPQGDLICASCAKGFKHRRSLSRHVRESHGVGKEQKLKCDKCDKSFKTVRTLKQHHALKHGPKISISCGKCGVHFNHAYELKVHQRLKRCGSVRSEVLRKRFSCRLCKQRFLSLKRLYAHKSTEHSVRLDRLVCNGCWRRYKTPSAYLYHTLSCPERKVKRRRFDVMRQKRLGEPNVDERGVGGLSSHPSTPAEAEWESRSAVDGNARVHLLSVHDENDLQLTLIQNKHNIETVLRRDLTDLHRIKWYMTAFVRVQVNDKDADKDSNIRYMRCKPLSTLREDEIEEHIREGITGVINSFDSALDEGSSVLFERVEKLELRVAKLSLLKGSSFLHLPEWLAKPSKGLINIQNHADEKCFLYSILAGLSLPRHHAERVSSYRHRLGEVNMKGIKYPVKINDISKFEGNNKHISVSVFALEGGVTIVPLRISRELLRPLHINLLFLTDSDTGDSHYVLIKNLSRFLSHTIKRDKRQFWCDNCLTPHNTLTNLTAHRVKCIEHNAQKICMPCAPHNVMKFTDYEKQLRHDYVIYCDLESVLKPYSTVLPDPSKSSTTRTSQHIPSGFCYIIMGPDGVQEPVLEHGGDDIILRLLLRLQAEATKISMLRGPKYPLDMTETTEKAFQSAKTCYMCDEPIPRHGVPKVRDHDHQRKKDNYRGAACQGCNLNLKMKDFIPVFFHNFSGYDAHHIISSIGLLSDGSNLSAIPKTKEKYISFTWGRLRFLDSFNFLSSGLDKLVRDLKPEEMETLATFFPDSEKRGLVSRKGVYPYCYFDSFEKFCEKKLPPKECFKSDLTGESVSDADYEHALKVFDSFAMDNLWDYHDLYLLTDTLLLCDVMETYRKVTMKHFKLDVVHYYTTPGFAWSAALLFTKQKLELLVNLDDHLMWEAGIRGGVSTINCRSANANNPYVSETYDADRERVYISYWDANNLYGAGLCRPLPIGGFRYLSQEEINSLDPKKIEVNDPYGFLFEVSLSYPSELHDAHNDYCLAPERAAPEFEDLSPLQKEMIKIYNLPEKCPSKKLIPNLRDKKNYVVYGTTLRLYLELGLVLKEVHRVMTFEQKAWLAPFINHNTEMRKKATSDFQKNLWKLKNNSCYGKAIEQVRHRRNVAFTKKSSKFAKLVRSPLFHSFDIFDHGLVVVERKKASVCLDRPVYTGQVVLDVSKEIMYDFHYNCVKARYGDKIKVCGSDTDSLIYEIKTNDLYKDMEEMNEYLDTSDYPTDHPLYSTVNKKVIGKFKDEMNGMPIKSFVGLRPKMYAFQRGDSVEKCVGKGIPRAALKSQLTFNDYKQCLKNMSTKRVSFSKIGTDRKHHLFTTFSTKRGLSCFDDKRYILSNNVNTLAYGHYLLRKEVRVEVQDGVEMESEEEEAAQNLRELLLLMDVE